MTAKLHGHTDRIITIGYDATCLYSSSKDRTIRVWNRNTRECVHILTGFAHSPKISVDEQYLYVVSHTALSVWDKRTWTQIYHEVLPTGSDLQSVLHDRRHLYAAVRDGRIFIIDRESFALKHEIQAHTGGIWGLAQDADRLYSASVDTTIKIWHKCNYTLQRTLAGHTANIQALAVNEAAIYSFATNKLLIMWAKASGERRASQPNVFRTGLLGVFCHPRVIIAASAAEGLRLFAPTTLEPVAVVDYTISNGKALAIDGDMLYLGLTDHTIAAVSLDDLLSNAHPRQGINAEIPAFRQHG